MIRKSSKSAGDPSDLDLMLYADGELEGEARAAVEAYLARTATGKAKAAALSLLSDVVREQALGAAGKADGIADAVMAKIAVEGATTKGAPPPKPVAITNALRAGEEQVRRNKPPANDNSRRIFALAAVAVAAAAGLMIWSRMDATSPQVGHDPVAISTTSHQHGPTPPSTAEPTANGEDELGVEVAAVDFGARMGTIFYVPMEETASNVTTTVVWLNDDDSDDDSSGEE
jgi:hypothetical protein